MSVACQVCDDSLPACRPLVCKLISLRILLPCLCPTVRHHLLLSAASVHAGNFLSNASLFCVIVGLWSVGFSVHEWCSVCVCPPVYLSALDFVLVFILRRPCPTRVSVCVSVVCVSACRLYTAFSCLPFRLIFYFALWGTSWSIPGPGEGLLRGFWTRAKSKIYI